jgi:hypothetical protein
MTPSVRNTEALCSGNLLSRVNLVKSDTASIFASPNRYHCEQLAIVSSGATLQIIKTHLLDQLFSNIQHPGIHLPDAQWTESRNQNPVRHFPGWLLLMRRKEAYGN